MNFFTFLIGVGLGMGIGFYLRGHQEETKTRLSKFVAWVKSKPWSKKPEQKP